MTATSRLCVRVANARKTVAPAGGLRRQKYEVGVCTFFVSMYPYHSKRSKYKYCRLTTPNCSLTYLPPRRVNSTLVCTLSEIKL